MKILRNLQAAKEDVKKWGLVEGVYRRFVGVSKKVIDDSIDFVHSCYWYVYSRIFDRPLIHVVGDSHVRSFRNRRLFIVHYIGAATAFNLGKKSSTTDSNRKLFKIVDKLDKKRDILMLVLGEIDCRVHIYYQHKKSGDRVSISDLIDRTVRNYGVVLDELASRNIRFLVYGVPPAGRRNTDYGYPMPSPGVKVRIFREFNEKMKGFCKKKGYAYIDVLSRFSDPEGFILSEYDADGLHLNSRIESYVRLWINSEFGINI